MKKSYTSVQIEVFVFDAADIIVTSLLFEEEGLGDSVDWDQVFE